MLDEVQTHVVDAWPFPTHKCVHFSRSLYRSLNGEVLRQLKVNLWNKPVMWIVSKRKAEHPIIIISNNHQGKRFESWKISWLELIATRRRFFLVQNIKAMNDEETWNEARKVSSLFEIWRVFIFISFRWLSKVLKSSSSLITKQTDAAKQDDNSRWNFFSPSSLYAHSGGDVARCHPNINFANILI